MWIPIDCAIVYGSHTRRETPAGRRQVAYFVEEQKKLSIKNDRHFP